MTPPVSVLLVGLLVRLDADDQPLVLAAEPDQEGALVVGRVGQQLLRLSSGHLAEIPRLGSQWSSSYY